MAGLKLDLFVISFVKDKMTLRVPVTKATTVGMRKLADAPTVKRALETVRGRARIKRTMWSRRAQEYEAKINSGDLISIAEVVRDLFRSETQPEQSYSERQLYEAALDRMSREISSVNKISETEAIRQIEQNLAKSPRRGAKPGSRRPTPRPPDRPPPSSLSDGASGRIAGRLCAVYALDSRTADDHGRFTPLCAPHTACRRIEYAVGRFLGRPLKPQGGNPWRKSAASRRRFRQGRDARPLSRARRGARARRPLARRAATRRRSTA